MGVENFAIHLAYSTFPTGNERDFIENKLHNFTRYVEDTQQCMIEGQELDACLYKPLVFHLFGTFDVVFISLIDNYKFCQKVFDIEPSGFDVTTNYQIVTGICDPRFTAGNNSSRITSFFPCDNTIEERSPHSKFVHITNFKVNNGLLIGNGNQLIHAILAKLTADLGDTDFILFKSFSWSEIILVQLGDDLEKMQERVIEFREFSLRDVLTASENAVSSLEQLEQDSLYASILFEIEALTKEKVSLADSHVFVDTHSYSGVDYFQFNKDYEEKNNPYLLDKFKSSIELQVKPGHLHKLYAILDGHPIFDAQKLKFKNGKTDFLIKEKEHGGFYSNYIVNQVYRHLNSDIKHHVRKLKTNFLFDMVEETGTHPVTHALKAAYQPAKEANNGKGIVNFNQLLANKYTIDIRGLKPQIKRLGLSRQLREKILKAFSNYNNLIKDPILYGEFIELKEYLSFLKKDINKEVARLDDFFTDPILFSGRDQPKFLSLRLIEKKWTALLEIYEDAYHNRVHNNYLYEDINEFSIDFNSAVNQINSIQDYIVKNVNNIFFPYFKDQIIVTQNEVDSKSNVVNVNYNVYHYLEPTLIFTTLFKEVMNGVLEKAGNNKKSTNKEFYFQQIFNLDYFTQLRTAVIAKNKGIFSKEQSQLIENFDFFYFFSDLTKMAFTFLFDYELYEFWCWTYFLQDSSMYTTKGLPDAELFQKELLRIALIKKVFKKDEDDSFVKNPAPEIFDLWQKYVAEVDTLAEIIVQTSEFQVAKEKFSSYILGQSFGTLSDEDQENLWNENNAMESYIASNQKLTGIKGPRISDIVRKLDSGLIKMAKDDDVYNNLITQFRFIKNRGILFETYLKTKDYDFLKMDGFSGEDYVHNKENFYMICAVGHAVLSLFQKEIGTTRLLRRNWQEGSPIEKFIRYEDAGIFIDPCGGFFYNTPAIRKKCFGYVNTIIDYLWNAAEIDKKRLFKFNLDAE
ncbi:hypothetical protein [Ascidiimonas sp. W6]|uniref:hypothetical protein n=1 Tax=Ascidiimonas meishanensis TaxID=3128903 RepID=UPI0030EF5EB9